MNDILLNKNDVEFLESIKENLKGVFQRITCKATYILGIKIYRDRSRRLIGLSQSTYRQNFEKVQNGSGKERILACATRCEVEYRLKARPRLKIERQSKVIAYASAIGSIKYAMLCTRPIVYNALNLAREYNSDLGVDHWTLVKIILSPFQVFQDVLDRCLVIYP